MFLARRPDFPDCVCTGWSNQGYQSATAFVNAALSKDFWDGDATLSINSEDLLNTRREEFTIDNLTYFSRQKIWEPSVIRLNVTYHINKQKEEE